MDSAPTPAQLLPLASDQPLIQDTVERARALAPDDRIRILAGEHLAAPFQSVLPDLADSSYWIEPRARGTAPVLAWAAWKLARLDPNAVMVSLHADHLIDPIEGFRDTVATAVEVAVRDELLLSIGVVPDHLRFEPKSSLSSEPTVVGITIAKCFVGTGRLPIRGRHGHQFHHVFHVPTAFDKFDRQIVEQLGMARRVALQPEIVE